MEIPKQCVGDSRFGVASYHDKILFSEAQQTSASYSFWELLVDFLGSYKTYDDAQSESKGCWRGTATKLIADMTLDERIGGLAARYTTNAAATLLGQLKARGFAINKVRSATKREWVIPFSILEEETHAETEDRPAAP